MDDYSDDVPRWEQVETAGVSQDRRGSLSARHQRPEILAGARIRARAMAGLCGRHLRSALRRGRRLAGDHVARRSPAHHRPSGPYRRIRSVFPARAEPPGDLDDEPAGDRTAVCRFESGLIAFNRRSPTGSDASPTCSGRGSRKLRSCSFVSLPSSDGATMFASPAKGPEICFPAIQRNGRRSRMAG
jgi:hypothetical protein